LAVKRRASGDQNIEDDSCGPYIAALVVIQVEHFGCDVVGSPNKLVLALADQFFAQVLLPLIGQAEIDEFELEGLLG
jgi:hypothetical protein